jgi:hypothetical protein
VTLAHLHALSQATLATTAVALVFGRELKHFPSPVNPVLSVLAGTFLGFLVLGVWRATRRVPRTRLSFGSFAALVFSGVVAGFVGLPLVAFAVFG